MTKVPIGLQAVLLALSGEPPFLCFAGGKACLRTARRGFSICEVRLRR